MATAGHVDHGKSTLVRALTGTDPDRWAEEKERGMTIDLGFAWAPLPSGISVSFVDVPGHVRFLPNMLAGVGAVAGCLFVVAATEGWMPQSEEHLRILDLLGTESGVIALTKVAGLDHDEVGLAELELRDRVAGTFLAKAPMVAVDAPAGTGLDELRSALDRLVTASVEAVDRDRPRLWVDRSFSAPGSGTVVTGTLTGGSFAVGDQLAIVPGSVDPARVRGIQTHGSEVEKAGPGHRVAVNLVGPSRHEIGRGQALVRPGQWEETALFDAAISVVPGLDHAVSRRGAFMLHVGTRAVPAELQLLGGLTGLSPGEGGTVRVRLPPSSAVPLLPGDRFVIRETGRDETVAGGEVLEVAPVARPGRSRPDRSVERLVRERGWVRVDLLERLTGERLAPNVGEWVVDPLARTAAEAQLRAAVTAAGPIGVEVSSLDARTRALAELMEDIELSGDRARFRGAAVHDERVDRWLAGLQADRFSPPLPPPEVDGAALRDLVRRSIVVEVEGFYFHPSAVEGAAQVVADLLAADPEGVTVAAVREALGTSRKWAMPLLARLDATGVTRRRGDLRIGGPRLPGARKTES